MRFQWRHHLAVMAFAVVSLTPLTGCSSSQQEEMDEEITATDQEGGDGEQQAEADVGSEGQEGGQESANMAAENAAPTDNAAMNQGDAMMNQGEEVVTNNAAPVDAGSANGDLQDIISEMNGQTGGGEAVAAEGGAEAAPAPEAAAPEAVAAVPDPAAASGAQPAAPAAAPSAALPEVGSKMPYVVETGDTLGKIAQKIYGDQTRWRELANLTGIDNPNHIYPGDVVYYALDDKSAGFASTYDGIRRSQDTVRDGDTLASIAKRVYGSSKAWKHIWRQNDQIENPDKLQPGMTIYYLDKSAIKTTFNKNIKHATKQLVTKTWAKSAKTITLTSVQMTTPHAFVVSAV